MAKHSSSSTQPQHIAVTGTTGFIGRHVIQKLHQEGHQLWAIVRPTTTLPSELKKMLRPITFDGDIQKLATELQQNQISGIIHLASLFLAQHKVDEIPELVNSNVLFGTQLLEAATQSNLKWFVNTGTFWQHFENELYSPVNLYAATKQAFLTMAQYYYETKPINFVTLELSDTFGPNDPRPKLISLWRKIARSGEALPMSAGQQKIDLNYVGNVADAFSQAVKLVTLDLNFKYRGQTYAVSSGRNLNLKELANIFEQVSGQKLAIGWGQKTYRPREVMIPWSKGKMLPGWKPRISLKEGLRRTLAVE